MNLKSLKKISFIGINIIALIVGIFLLISDLKENYEFMVLLPFAFLIVSCINIRVYNFLFNKISITIVILLYFLRMVLLPIIIVICDYGTIITNNTHFEYINSACLLMIYEFFCVMFFVNIYTKNVFNADKNKVSDKVYIKENMIFFNLLVLVLLVFSIIMFIIYPELKYYITFIFESDMENVLENNINFYNMRNSIPGVIYWIATFAIIILQFLIPICLICFIYNRKLSEKFKIFLSFLVILGSLFVSTPEKASSIIIAIASGIMLIYLYPLKAKNILKIIIIGGGISIIGGLLIKSGITYREVNVSALIQAYFSGVNNVAASFLITERFSFTLMYNDICNSIPFILAFFSDKMTTTVLYNYYIYNSTELVNQIIPMVGQGLCYFGVVLSPILSVISIILSIKCEKFFLNIQNPIVKYIYIYIIIMLAVSPVIYNFTILLKNILRIFVPTLLMSKLIIKNKE